MERTKGAELSGLDPRLRGRVACPVCMRAFDEGLACLICSQCALAFPIVDGVPILLPARAKKVSKAKAPKVG